MILRRSLVEILRSTLTNRHASCEPVLLPRAIVRFSYATLTKASPNHPVGKKQAPSRRSPKGAPEYDTYRILPSGQQGIPANDEAYARFVSGAEENGTIPFPDAAEAKEKPRFEKRNWSRPAEIPFQPKIANTVDLIGRIGFRVHLETLPDGSECAVTVLERKEVDILPQLWVPVIFEGDLAAIAACHLKENDLVHVSGQLSADSPQIIIENRESTVKVMAQSLNFVSTKSQPSTKEHNITQLSGKEKDWNSTESLWVDFLENPGNWLDNRMNKTKSSQPDFKRKSSGEALWIGKYTPAPAMLALESATFCEKLLKITAIEKQPTLKHEDLWKDLINSPDKWWDNRLAKRHPRGPDFKHKETGKGLWLDSSPDWVRSHYSSAPTSMASTS